MHVGHTLVTFISVIAFTFSGSGLIPSPSTIWPRNLMLVLHFSALSVTPAHLILSKTATSRSSCSSWVYQQVINQTDRSLKSSNDVWHLLLEVLRGWGDSKRESVKQNLPNRVMNIVRMADSSDLPKHWVSIKFGKDLGICKLGQDLLHWGEDVTLSVDTLIQFCELNTDSHIPFNFGTTAITAHQSMGFSTLVTTPNCSMCCCCWSVLLATISYMTHYHDFLEETTEIEPWPDTIQSWSFWIGLQCSSCLWESILVHGKLPKLPGSWCVSAFHLETMQGLPVRVLLPDAPQAWVDEGFSIIIFLPFQVDRWFNHHLSSSSSPMEKISWAD